MNNHPVFSRLSWCSHCSPDLLCSALSVDVRSSLFSVRSTREDHISYVCPSITMMTLVHNECVFGEIFSFDCTSISPQQVDKLRFCWHSCKPWFITSIKSSNLTCNPVQDVEDLPAWFSILQSICDSCSERMDLTGIISLKGCASHNDHWTLGLGQGL